jgi:hypothetical protein
VAFRFLTEGIDTTTLHGEFLYNLFGTLAPYGRSLIRERGSMRGWPRRDGAGAGEGDHARLIPRRSSRQARAAVCQARAAGTATLTTKVYDRPRTLLHLTRFAQASLPATPEPRWPAEL